MARRCYEPIVQCGSVVYPYREWTELAFKDMFIVPILKSYEGIMLHEEAGHLTITLGSFDNEFTMVIQDNGAGMSKQDLHKGMGLRIMKYRAEIIGAFFKAGNAEEGGFKVSVSHRY